MWHLWRTKNLSQFTVKLIAKEISKTLTITDSFLFFPIFLYGGVMTSFRGWVCRGFFLFPIIMAILCFTLNLSGATPPLLFPGGMRAMFSGLLPMWLAVSNLFLWRTRYRLFYRTLIFLRMITPYISVTILFTVVLWGGGVVLLVFFFILLILYRWRLFWWRLSDAFVTSGLVWTWVGACLFSVTRFAERKWYHTINNAFKDCNSFSAWTVLYLCCYSTM